MDVGQLAAGAANAAAAAAHATTQRAPVEEFVPEVEASTEASSDAADDRQDHLQHVLSKGEGHKRGVIKHLSDEDLSAMVSMLGPSEASSAAAENTVATAESTVTAEAVATENVSAFSERVQQALLAEVARREQAAPPRPDVEPAADVALDPVSVRDVVAESTQVVDLSAKNFPDPTLATLLAEMGSIEAPDATQAAQLA